ncbi:hypothetical protein [Arthrobacter sp. RAF14]|uniref:hypothetical protein n=1 Tax=Arthrobacter sp. RAF14 TaxID=3233051 RepID=UPI003F8FFFBA
MTFTERPRRIEDAGELVHAFDLRAVNEKSFSARRSAPGSAQEPSQSVHFEVGISEENELATQFAFQFVDEGCAIESVFTAIWAASEPATVSGIAMGEFLERVAIMAIYPYQREALATYAARLRVPVPTLGLIRQGDVNLQINVDSLNDFLKDKVFLPATEL